MNQESKAINVHLEKRENKDYLVFGFEEVAEVCLNDIVVQLSRQKSKLFIMN